MNMFASCKMLTLVTCGGKIILSSPVIFSSQTSSQPCSILTLFTTKTFSATNVFSLSSSVLMSCSSWSSGPSVTSWARVIRVWQSNYQIMRGFWRCYNSWSLPCSYQLHLSFSTGRIWKDSRFYYSNRKPFIRQNYSSKKARSSSKIYSDNAIQNIWLS